MQNIWNLLFYFLILQQYANVNNLLCMRLIIKKDYDMLSDWAAEYVINRILSFHPTPSRPFVLGLPTGSTPLGLYVRMVSAYKEGRVSFRDVVTFNMDEYVGLPEAHPASYHSFMERNLFSQVDLQPDHIHLLNGNAPDLEAECRDYERLIAEYGGVDLFIGGMGVDGHIAFNEPGTSLGSRTHVQLLATSTLQANSRFFSYDAFQVPRKALTVGVATVMDAREVLVLASGHAKAHALWAAVEGPVSQQSSVSALQMHPQAVVVCDEAATDELRVGTYKYFKNVER